MEDRLKHISFKDALLHAMPWCAKARNGKASFGINDAGANSSVQAQIRASINKKNAVEPNFWTKIGPELLASASDVTATTTMTAITFTDSAGTAVNANLAGAGDVDAAVTKVVTFLQAFDEADVSHWEIFGLVVGLGIWMPLKLVLTRPFIEHHMFSAILAVAGTDTGATLFGPSDMQIASNVAVKVIEGHYTLHSKAIIQKPQNVHVMADIMCDGYVAGCDTTWFGDTSMSYTNSSGAGLTWAAAAASANSFIEQHVASDVKERLDFEHEVDGMYPSLLAFAVPYNEKSVRAMRWQQSCAFSLVDGYTPWNVGANVGSQLFPGGDENFKAYTEIFGLNEISHGIDPSQMKSHNFIRTGTTNNSIVLQGPYRAYSPFTESHFDLTPGHGHFGPDALPGDARWRRGEAVSLEAARNSMVSIEAAAHSQLVFQKK